MRTATNPDCRTCGACCTNPAENRAEGFVDWVEIEADEPSLRRPRLARLVIVNADGVAHLRLDPAGRCVALRGRIGESVRCAVYEQRPRACRRLEAGSPRCREYRHERGLE